MYVQIPPLESSLTQPFFIQLLRFVQSFGITPDTVTVIRERISGISMFYSLPMLVD
jgi:hypothetical protein